ncbi:hypothetical protein GRI75_03650 [Altererythrobacter soli]|uniref:Uncharacterized protein n=1 Tax=Croceibacterium soli TaxID=1739690 RepID=A0A6I4UT18_9SPHN|nr:hypothetical protein [Croceibacterium soli]MXP40743.1 hypothetical protein [Croceibacterium soli]
MKRHAGLGAAAGLALLSWPAQSQPGPDQAAANWQAVVACAGQADAGSRHACVDRVLRAAGVLDPAREAAAQRQSFGAPERRAEPAVAPPAVAPPPAAAAAAAASPQAGAVQERAVAAPPAISGIETTVSDALIGGDRLLIVATSEGAIWKQVDGGPFRRLPAKGSAFAVEEGALGSYRCKIGSDVFRCRRVD